MNLPNVHRIPPLLPSVCLCAIVRDEETNPAGGIQLYLNRILSYVHSAVIVDTGSVDRTKEILTRAQELYAHLHVYETPFQSFAQARNFSLDKCLELRASQQAAYTSASASSSHTCSTTPLLLPPFRHVLVLDADEELSLSTLELLAEILNEIDPGSLSTSASKLQAGKSSPVTHSTFPPTRHPLAIKLSCHCFDSTGLPAPRSNSGLWNPRIFTLDTKLRFKNLVDSFRFERLYWMDEDVSSQTTNARDTSVTSSGGSGGVPQQCYVRESDLSPGLRKQYDTLLATIHAAHGADTPPTQLSPTSAGESRFAKGGLSPTSASATATTVQSGTTRSLIESALSSTAGELPSYLRSSSVISLPPRPVQPPEDDLAGIELPLGNLMRGVSSDELYATSSTGDDFSQLLALPMRHYIPSLQERRRKNKRYKAGGEAAAKSASMTVTTGSGSSSTSVREPSSSPTQPGPSGSPSLFPSGSPKPPHSAKHKSHIVTSTPSMF